MIKTDLCIVVPIGISSHDTPIKKYLLDCIDSLKNQKTKFSYDVIFACDDNVSDEIKEILLNCGFKIQWYEPYFYFRKGGIWKKIYDQWLRLDSEYVAFCHYDDIWHEDRVENQINFMKENNLENSWSNVQKIDINNNILSNDVCNILNLNSKTIYSNSYAFCHSCITKKDSIISSNILQYMEKWSGIYEKLFFVYAHMFKGLKCNNSIFYHRVHNSSITNTLNNEQDINVINQRTITNYSLSETVQDVNDIDINKIIESIIYENNLS